MVQVWRSMLGTTLSLANIKTGVLCMHLRDRNEAEHGVTRPGPGPSGLPVSVRGLSVFKNKGPQAARLGRWRTQFQAIVVEKSGYFSLSGGQCVDKLTSSSP